MKKYILSLDQGTTSSRAILFDKNAEVVKQKNIEFKQIYPKPGWVEHDPFDILGTVMQTVKELLSETGISYDDIDSIGITNQRETTIVWDKKTGKPVYNAIVWQCRRTSDRCSKIKESGYDKTIFEKTGLVADPYFSATKIEYLLDSIDGLKAKAAKGEIAFGTVDSWLIYNLTGGKRHVTDYSNASRTMLFNIHTLKWDDELLSYFNIPRAMLPEVIPNSQKSFSTSKNFFGAEIPITGIAGDQQSSLFGQCCFNEGDIKNTYGTGCFLLMNTGAKAMTSKNKMLSTIAWNIDGVTTYALEGAVFIAGAAVGWLRDTIRIIDTSAESEHLAYESTNDEIMFIPAFSGLGTPYWDPDVKGAIFGLTRDTDRKDIAKAALEGIAYQAKDLIDALEKDAGAIELRYNADGGATKNKYLMQFQSDIMQREIYVANMSETTSLGAAFLAGLATEFFPDMEYLIKLAAKKTVFKPKMTSGEAQSKMKKWKQAVAAVRLFARE
jgi:glycerol kinase